MVVVAADQDEVVKVSPAAVGPVDGVVGVQPSGVVAAGELAGAAIASFQQATQRFRDGAVAPSGVRVGHSGVAGEAPDGFRVQRDAGFDVAARILGRGFAGQEGLVDVDVDGEAGGVGQLGRLVAEEAGSHGCERVSVSSSVAGRRRLRGFSFGEAGVSGVDRFDQERAVLRFEAGVDDEAAVVVPSPEAGASGASGGDLLQPVGAA